MKVIGIIPARYNSSRFSGKPLVIIHGKTMIRRVYEQACKALDIVYVATDDDRIKCEVVKFGGKVVMTSTNHQSGTDRCAEAVQIIQKIDNDNFDIVVNIQGDEPFINPEQIKMIVSCFENQNTQIATLIKEIQAISEISNQNTPKVVVNKNLEAIYFSRSVIPFNRNKLNVAYYKHIGMYAYKINVLFEITKLQPSSLELSESLEQLRWLENGYKIQTAITNLDTISIDTKEDLEKAVKYRF
ncbi:MAG TPA: 3-deoxy-manno-octulosonate cytidylyltransferase [Bacteroidales bacterium]|nr:MAG: 3-deoxy-manno-octulosonate cytidylyltransferase [Bacteroidetes bacterium GWF2_33_38]OFY89321.1 MAG: 3-deoxy-manno-octulosonate cytidylyltransferase [Bacteroidetes bacterium RIFOXYA2_FULL_33_7]HBF89253.1 3-deoxy-manno-octulosonate cytidylyltransferase [Bacteroidales bacterium]